MKTWEENFYKDLHATKIKLPKEDNPSLFPPLYDSIKYTFNESDSVLDLFTGERDGYLYARYKNPNSAQLSEFLSKTQNKKHTVLTPNGVSAICLSLESLAHPNSFVLYFDEAYAPTKSFIKKHLSKWGVSSDSCNIDDHESIKEIFKTQSPDLLIFESPTNPQLKVADINFLINLCKENDCISIMDNTFASLHQHLDYDIDIIIHSLSKFASGHGDLMGGSISTNNDKHHKDIQDLAHAKGVSMEPSVARDFMKSMQTFPLRYKAYCHNAFKLAKSLETSKLFPQVIYPGLRSHPEHSLAHEQQIQPGNVIYLELPENTDCFKFMDQLKHFTLSPSLGSNESLIAPALAFYGAGLSQEELESVNINKQMIRLSIGLDSADLLFEDIKKGLAG